MSKSFVEILHHLSQQMDKLPLIKAQFVDIFLILLVRLVSPFNGELSFIMAAILWSDRFVKKESCGNLNIKGRLFR